MGGLDRLKGFNDRLNKRDEENDIVSKRSLQRGLSQESQSALSFNRNFDMKNFKDPLEKIKAQDDSKSPGNVKNSSGGTQR